MKNLTDPDIDLLFPSITYDLDSTVFLLLVECVELSLLLPVVEGTNQDNNDDGNNDGGTFHEADARRVAGTCRILATGFGFVLRADILINAKGQRNYSGNTEGNLVKMNTSGEGDCGCDPNIPKPCP